MSDEHDFAQDIAAREREYLLAKRQPLEMAAVAADGDCEDCGTEIPEDRRKAAPWASRCVSCQGIHERGRR
jgi:phage/conjugal plasmid C-4 type zinc finger TraR family protein